MGRQEKNKVVPVRVCNWGLKLALGDLPGTQEPWGTERYSGKKANASRVSPKDKKAPFTST